MRSVFTVATGADKYFQMAINLARSFCLHNPANDIQFKIYTDRDRMLPQDLRSVELIVLPPEHSDPGLAFKINFDAFAPRFKSIFVDCDCFVLRDLGPVFEFFEGQELGVLGVHVKRGEWCGAEVDNVLNLTGFEDLARFNGGLYYLDMSKPSTQSIFAAARRWTQKYQDLGFALIGKHYNDEPLISLAMAEHSTRACIDSGSIAADVNFDKCSRVDVIRDGASLINYPVGHPARKWWYSTEIVEPTIVHYGSGGFGRYLYTRESLKLYLVCALGVPVGLVNRVIDPAIRLSYRIWSGAGGTTL